MTPEEREQVVELLRCAAWIHETRPSFMPIDDAATEMFGEEHTLVQTHPTFELACDAIEAIDVGPCSVAQLLEVAQRVEEGSWP